MKYNDQNIILDGENKNTIKELPVEVFIENNSIFIDKDGNVLDWKNADLINSKIGNVVNGYSAADLERQLFYSTPVETYLISKTLAKTNWSVPLNREKQSDDEEEYKYKGLEDVKKLEYGSKWNKKWLKKCINNQAKGDSAKVTAYMCDPINWKEYAIDGVANYAVGGPTLELLIASYNKSQGTNIELLDEDIISTNGVELYKPNALIVKGSLSVNNGVYNSGQNYRLSTPLNYYGYYTGIIDGGQGRLDRAYWHDSNIGARTIVSIPTSKISINGDTVTVNP